MRPASATHQDHLPQHKDKQEETKLKLSHKLVKLRCSELPEAMPVSYPNRDCFAYVLGDFRGDSGSTNPFSLSSQCTCSLSQVGVYRSLQGTPAPDGSGWIVRDRLGSQELLSTFSLVLSLIPSVSFSQGPLWIWEYLD